MRSVGVSLFQVLCSPVYDNFCSKNHNAAAFTEGYNNCKHFKAYSILAFCCILLEYNIVQILNMFCAIIKKTKTKNIALSMKQICNIDLNVVISRPIIKMYL